MNEIEKRYLTYNAHAGSYTWKYDQRNLNMDQTLEVTKTKKKIFVKNDIVPSLMHNKGKLFVPQ